MFHLAALLVLSTSCGAHNPDFVTKHGLSVYLNDEPSPTQEQVELATDLVIKHLIAHVGGHYQTANIQDALLDTFGVYTLMLRPGPSFSCASSPTGLCAGRFSQNSFLLEVATDTTCIAVSALTHELAHWFMWLIETRIDHMHADGRFFAAGCKGDVGCMRASVERASNMDLCGVYCPEIGCE